MPEHEVHVRKARAGTDSAGHVWPQDGAVIEVPYVHALVLAAIPDGGFTIVNVPAAVEAASADPVADDEPDSAAAAKPIRRKAAS